VLSEIFCALLIDCLDCRKTLVLAVKIEVILSQSKDTSRGKFSINLLEQAALKKVMSSKPINPLALLEPQVPSNTICWNRKTYILEVSNTECVCLVHKIFVQVKYFVYLNRKSLTTVYKVPENEFHQLKTVCMCISKNIRALTSFYGTEIYTVRFNS
jgi:hypothetical protein